MPYEVELKFPIPDPMGLELALLQLGARRMDTRMQVDLYLNHPARSFAQTDEALRVRQSNSQLFLTYKGPKIDSTTKSRVELELELAGGPETRDESVRFFGELGFQPVREVRKERTLFHVQWNGKLVKVCMDKVDGLGDFLELEVDCETADLEPARQTVLTMAQQLGLGDSERRSYLELLLEGEAEQEDWSET